MKIIDIVSEETLNTLKVAVVQTKRSFSQDKEQTLERVKITQHDNSFVIGKFDLMKLRQCLADGESNFNFNVSEKSDLVYEMSSEDFMYLKSISKLCGFYFKIDKINNISKVKTTEKTGWELIPEWLKNEIKVWAEYYDHTIFPEENCIIYNQYSIIELSNEEYQKRCAELKAKGVKELAPAYDIRSRKVKLFFNYVFLRSNRIVCSASNHLSRVNVNLLHEISQFHKQNKSFN
jgi:hypothetical protein